MHRGWVGVGIPWAIFLFCGCGTAAKSNSEAVSSDPLISCESFGQRFEACQSKRVRLPWNARFPGHFTRRNRGVIEGNGEGAAPSA
jgi:hypothetical protein